MRYFLILISLILLFQTENVQAQYYDTGQDPSSLKWLQIKTGRFTVIYPEKYGSGGKAFAASLDQAYSKLVTLFPEKKFNIPVIIHNFSTQSNGYVAWAPKRMEIFPTPEQNSIPLDANDQLALHELTHVFQMESLNTGFSRGMALVLGEQFTGVTSSLLPLWLLEGDAVFSESFLSGSGRGRVPSFQKELKALVVESGSSYKYDKSINGSYRNFIPDYYESGFQIVTWALAKYDHQIWNRVFNFTGAQPFTLNPVNISLEKSAGLTKKRLYQETFDTLRTIWSKDVSADSAVRYESLNPEKKGRYINYYSPVFAGKDSIIAIKTSLTNPPVFVLMRPSDKSERTIHTPGQIFPWFITYAKGKLVWVETIPDKRWENRDYSVVKLLDTGTGQTRRLTSGSRYLSASISPEGKIISAVENTQDNQNNLILIDAETGKVLQSVPAPGNSYIQRPQWASGGKVLTVIYLDEKGEGIMSYTLADHSWKTLVAADRQDLQSSLIRNDSLFFISSQSGTDNIYLKTPDNRIIRLTRSRFGTIDLCFAGSKLLFSDYSSLGNSICTSGIFAASGDQMNKSLSSFLINRVDISQQHPISDEGINYTPEPYRKWQHLFRFHSWMPFYTDIEQLKTNPAAISPGLSILTQNSLSTLTSTIGYEYSKQNKNVFHSRITWKGWYPVIESQLDYGENALINKAGESVANPSVIQPGLALTNTISLPLQFSSGMFSEYLRSSFEWEYMNNYVYKPADRTYDYGQSLLTYRIFFSNYSTSALRDIYPKWAQVIDLNYTHAPFDNLIYGSIISMSTSFYFPGLLPNNGLKISFDKEKQSPAVFLLGSKISFPRGYNNIISTNLTYISADYVMPLFYPDFNISSLLYLKRIRSGFFYDFASGTGNYYYNRTLNGSSANYFNNYNETFSSFGLSLLADFHLLRIPYQVSAGVQSAWKQINKPPVVEMIFNINLFGFSIGKRRL